MKKILNLISLLSLITMIVGCTRIETGETGLRKNFNGIIEDNELGPGIHQTMVGEVIVFAVKEILLAEENLTPQSKDKSSLKDFDISFTYSATPTEVSHLYTHYSTTAHLKQDDKHNEIFPMGSYVKAVVRAAAYSAVSEYDVLEINNNRAAIERKIAAIANEKFKTEKLEGKIQVISVNVKNIQLADDVVASANNAVKAQNDLLTKRTEVQIAGQEAERIKALSSQSGEGYIRLLEAQAKKQTAEALLVAAQNKSAIWVVPNQFTALGNIAAK